MSSGRIDRHQVVARVTIGILPSICMVLILGSVMAFFWAQYRLNARLASKQGSAIDSAIVEGRAFHHREGRLMRRVAIQVGIPPDEVERIMPESTLDVRPIVGSGPIRPIWMAF